MSSGNLLSVVTTQKAFIKELLDRLENKETKLDMNASHNYIFVNIQGKSYLLSLVVNMLNDSYFNGLSLVDILELAKKSIKLTDDNCKMQHKLENIADLYDDSELSKKIKKIIESEDK